MIAIGLLFVRILCDCFKSRRRLEAEILILRHQLNVLRRAPRRGLNLRWVDRALFIWLYRCCPRILDAITIVRPETVVRWHRKGFVASWRWRSRSSGGRPRIAKEVRDLIRRMSFENPLWGATKIHGELLNWHRGRPVHGFDLYGAPAGSAIADLEDLPSQSYGGDCIDRSVCCSNDYVSTAIRISCSEPRTAALVVVRGDPQSDGGVVSTANYRSVPVGQHTEISHPRQ